MTFNDNRLFGSRICLALRSLRHLLCALLGFAFCPFALASSNTGDPVFTAALISGSKQYNAEQLAVTYRPHLGLPLSQERIESVVDAIEEFYAKGGQAGLSIALDESLIGQGILRLVIDEGGVQGVRIQGSAGPHQAQVERWLNALHENSASRDEVSAAVRKISRLPGVDISARLLGNRQLVAELRYEPFESIAYMSNRGIDELGQHFIAGRFRVNNFANGLGVVDLNASLSPNIDQYRGAGIRVQKQFFEKKNALTAGVNFSEAEPDVVAGSDPLLFKRNRGYLGYSRQLLDGKDFAWSWSMKLQARNSEYRNPDDVAGTILREERVRSLELATRVALRSQAGARYVASGYARKGINGLGSGIEYASSTTDPRELDFWLTGIEVRRITRPAERWSLELAVAGQFTDSILPGSERFRIGGQKYGRAYELSEVSGDRGASAKAELGRDVDALENLLPGLSVYGFYDVGAIWPQDYSGRQSAASTGLGLRTRSDKVRAYLEAAQPLTRPSEVGGNDVKVFGGITVMF